MFSGSLLTVYVPCLQKKLYTRSHSARRTSRGLSFSSPVSDVSIVEYCFLFFRFMMPEAFNIGSLPFNADCGLLSIRDARGIKQC